ncbi:MAG: cytochrome c3 family protein [Candidatus Hydrogenedentes bacterium]|nr:cytochrome c3 family protein [Candidatus Hydrogenedentota bacterium]
MLRKLISREPLTYALLAGFVLGLVALSLAARSYHLPDNHQDYEPEQPIAFSHRLHAGELALDCRYCHFGAATSRHAGIPAASVCMNCHKFVTATMGALRAEERIAKEEKRAPGKVVSPELAKLYRGLGLNEKLEPDPAQTPTGIAWVKIHNLPDYVYFDHRAHVSAGVACQTCHGSVETMERVRQVESLAMGWCVNCHREANRIGVQGKPVQASVDCATCHY